MKLDSDSMRGFLAQYTNFKDLHSTDLDSLVIKYRQSQNSIEFATIYNKVLGVVLKFGRESFADLGLTEDDIYSKGMEALNNALNIERGWKPESNVKFITYFYRVVHNSIITLQNKKSQRDYKKFHQSLDELIEDPALHFDICEENSPYHYVKSKKESSKESVSILTKSSNEDKLNLAFNLGISVDNLELAIIAAKVKYKLATKDEIEHLKNSKTNWRKVKNKLKTLV